MICAVCLDDEQETKCKECRQQLCCLYEESEEIENEENEDEAKDAETTEEKKQNDKMIIYKTDHDTANIDYNMVFLSSKLTL